MTLPSKPVGEREKEVLEALKDGKFQKFSDLKKTAGVSGPTLSISLKNLQKTKLVKKDIDSRKYVLDTEGLRWLKTESVANTIRSGSLSEQELVSPPVDSIVALDAPNMPEAQRRVFMRGTPDIAKACFNQFLVDTRKGEGFGNYPASGRVVYTAAIDLEQARTWLNTEQGKKYLSRLERKKP